jgi:hypothetical protein
MPYIKLKNYSGQVLADMNITAPKGATAIDENGNAYVFDKATKLHITHNNRLGINKYKINMVDKKTGKKYWQMNYAMDDEKTEGHAIWSLADKPYTDKQIFDKYGYKVKDGKRIKKKK